MEKHKHLNNMINSYVLAKYGEKAALNLQTRLTNLPDTHAESYTSDWLNITADNAGHCLDVRKRDFLKDVGASYIEQMLNKAEYQKIILNLGINFIEFVNNMDYLHSYIAHKTKTDLHFPVLRCAEGLGGSMELFFIASKCCYSPDFATGIISGISNLIFQSPITCKLRQEKIILLHCTERSVPMVEAGYDLNLQAMKNEPDALIIPLMLAQTNKNSERKISRSNVEVVNEELAHILETEGPEGHPLRKAARQKARMRWKKLGDVIRGAAFFKYLASRFQPIIPSHIEMNGRDFCSLMPFHIMIDRDSNIVHAGLTIQRQVPALKNFGKPLSEALKCSYPSGGINLIYDVIFSLVNTTFILYGEYHRKDRQSYFKGHFMVMNQPRRLMFVGSPYVRSIEECCDAGIKLCQISPYDMTREFILMTATGGQQHISSKKTVVHVTQRGRDVGVVSGKDTSSVDRDELARTKKQLEQANAQLDALKNRYKRLYLGLVPLSVVSNLNEQTRQALLPTETSMVDLTPGEGIESEVVSFIQGRGEAYPGREDAKYGVGDKSGVMGANGAVDLEKGLITHLDVHPSTNQRSISVDRGRLMKIQNSKTGKDKPVYQPNYIEYDGVCMMFCDVVQFTGLRDMDKALHTLTIAHRWLSRLCQVFHLEIVESIGDGFLVISHVSGRTRHQAARNMADCALAYLMLNRARFPSLQFRIGIHIGKIHGGVIERSQKTFIVWGQDVEFTCKLESFGLPDKIQISREFFSFINDGSFNLEEREGVSIRGHEPATYLLLTSSKIWSEVDLQELFGDTMNL